MSAEEPRHFARLLFSYSMGEQGVTIMQVVPEIGIGIGERWGLQLKVPYLSISGNLGSTNGVGDPVITASYALMKKAGKRFDGLIGIKLNANDAGRYAAPLKPLPMPYQTSLGTTDILLGANYRVGKWTTALAYQYVLKNMNGNDFDHVYWMDNADALGYFESAGLQRASDAVARVQYAFRWRQFAMQPGVLGIYHVTQDKRWDAMQQPERAIRIEGSDGLTLNLTVDARYTLSDIWSLEASLGTPAIVRETRPDGLTRSMVLNLGARLAF